MVHGRQLQAKEVTNKERDFIGIPRPVFLFTIEQILIMLSMTEANFFKKVAWLQGREIGHQRRDVMRVINIAKREEDAEWRVEESEFVRWARFHNFRTYERVL